MKQAEFQQLFASPLRNGVSYPSATRGSGVPMVNMGEAFKYDVIADQECERVPLTDTERQRYLLQEGDLLFVRQSLKYEGAGRCVYVAAGIEPRTWESHLIRVRLDSATVNPRYYYYYFRSALGRQSIEPIIHQVAAAGIRGSDLSRLQVPVPELPVQNAVVALLSALDDKIAINDRIAATYDGIFQAKFATLGTAGEGDCAITELVEFNPRTPRPTQDDAVYVDMAALPTRLSSIRTWAHRPPKGGSRFQNGDTVLARITPCLENGKTGYVDFLKDGETGTGSTEFIVMRSREGVPPEFSYFLARDERFREHAIRKMVGSSGRQRVSAADAADFFVRRPDFGQLSAFGAEVGVAFRHLKSLMEESRVLVRLRDTLLPELMSGRLRVRDAEKVVEEAV